jgi:hypothetical protein
MRGSGTLAAARRRERARCAAIFASPACSTQEGFDAACRLAFKSQTTRSEALTILSSMAGTARMTRLMSDSSGRAARNPQLGTFGGGVVSGAPANRMVELMRRSREGR